MFRELGRGRGGGGVTRRPSPVRQKPLFLSDLPDVRTPFIPHLSRVSSESSPSSHPSFPFVLESNRLLSGPQHPCLGRPSLSLSVNHGQCSQGAVRERSHLFRLAYPLQSSQPHPQDHPSVLPCSIETSPLSRKLTLANLVCPSYPHLRSVCLRLPLRTG